MSRVDEYDGNYKRGAAEQVSKATVKDKKGAVEEQEAGKRKLTHLSRWKSRLWLYDLIIIKRKKYFLCAHFIRLLCTEV